MKTIERAVAHFRADPEVRALLLVGSIAHGFAQASSDVDLAIVVSDAEHARRAAAGELVFTSFELATYPGGYVDGKYVSPSFLDAVEARGSEPARFAFAHARVLFGSEADLQARLERIARYPVAEKAERMRRFNAQMQAWLWYTTQAARDGNAYLMSAAVHKLLLFGGRLILAHNELLYPFHKWFLAVLERAEEKPEGLIEGMQALVRSPSAEGARAFYELVQGFRPWEPVRWPEHFMQDTELPWLHGHAPVEDV